MAPCGPALALYMAVREQTGCALDGYACSVWLMKMKINQLEAVFIVFQLNTIV